MTLARPSMSRILHRAIRDALRDAPAYEARAIAVSAVLESTADLDADENVLYDAVYRLFTAMPERLVRGSVLLITTQDTKDATELAWNAREDFASDIAPGASLTAGYPAGSPIVAALGDLERYCRMRAGYVDARVQTVKNSSSFARPAYLHRRVVAHLPRMDAGVAEKNAEPAATPDVRLVAAEPDPRRARRPFDARAFGRPQSVRVVARTR